MITVKKIVDRVLMLIDRFGSGAVLVIGSEAALLFDTGCGVDDMNKTVSDITSLPLTVIASHGHFDHIGGSRFFDRVYLSPKDRCILDCYDEELLNKWLCEMNAEVSGRIEFGCGGWDKIVPLSISKVPMGDITGEIIPVPGHSLGSVGVFFPELKLFLGGDALEPVMCMMFQNHGDRKMQYDSLKTVSELDFDHFITSHSDVLFQKSMISRMMECIERCDNGRFIEYDYPRPPYSRGYFHIGSMEDEPVGIIISEEENRIRLGK